MIKYSLHDILEIDKVCSEKQLIDSIVSEEIKSYFFVLEYKFKNRMSNKSKYNTPKPITFSDIRLSLNKLSNSSFSKQFKTIVSTLHIIVSECDDKNKLFSDVYDHIASNSFMVAPYTKLAIKLIYIFTEFEVVFLSKNKEFIDNLSRNEFKNDLQGDELHSQNKYKDEIKAQCMFICNILLKYHNEGNKNMHLHEDNLFYFQEYITNNIDDETVCMQEKIEFISSLYLIYASLTIKMEKTGKYNILIQSHVNYIMEKKANKWIKRKTIFNYMDLRDVLIKSINDN